MYIKIKGYETYEINKFGHVRHKLHGVWREVKTTPDCNGHYKIVTLWKNGKRKVFMLHNLVADTFCIPIEDAKRTCYEGYSLLPGAKERVRDFLISAIAEREQTGFIEESKYLRECLEVLK